MEPHLASTVNEQDRRGAGSIIWRIDEAAGQDPLPFQADAGIRQLPVRGALAVAKHGNDCRYIGCRLQQRPERLLGFPNFGPWRVQAGIAEPVQPHFKANQVAILAG